jgi:thiaminase
MSMIQSKNHMISVSMNMNRSCETFADILEHHLPKENELFKKMYARIKVTKDMDQKTIDKEYFVYRTRALPSEMVTPYIASWISDAALYLIKECESETEQTRDDIDVLLGSIT